MFALLMSKMPAERADTLAERSTEAIQRLDLFHASTYLRAVA